MLEICDTHSACSGGFVNLKHAAGKWPENELSFKRLRRMHEDVIDGPFALTSERQVRESHWSSADPIGSNEARAKMMYGPR